MRRFGTAFMMMGMLVATTIGAGIFTLPWVFHAAGWLWTTVLMVVLASLVVFAEYSYWRVLQTVGERQRLVGLARTHLGKEWGALVMVGVVGGMLFTLVIYLVLAQRFLGIILPLRGGMAPLLLFWAATILPMTFSIRRFVRLENAGVIIKILLILFIFFTASDHAAIFENPAPASGNPLFYFGLILFAFSGWNAVEPMYEIWRGVGKNGKEKKIGDADKGYATNVKPLAAIVGGVASIGVLYFLFSAGILGSLVGGSVLSADTLSGLTGWPFWKIGILALLGVVSLWTAYGTTALEVENALSKDLHWNPTLAFAAVALLPLLMVLGGFVNIIQIIGFAGAIFAGLQYMSIFALAERVLRPRRALLWATRLAMSVFAVAALYEIYIFVVG